jgi:hypothetical protein
MEIAKVDSLNRFLDPFRNNIPTFREDHAEGGYQQKRLLLISR